MTHWPTSECFLHLPSLFPDSVLHKTEEEISQYEDRHHYSGLCHKKQGCNHPYSQASKAKQDTVWKSGPLTWKLLSSVGQGRRGKGKVSDYS